MLNCTDLACVLHHHHFYAHLHHLKHHLQNGDGDVGDATGLESNADITDSDVQGLLNDTGSELSSLSHVDDPNNEIYMLGGVLIALILVGVIIVLVAITFNKLRKREESSNNISQDQPPTQVATIATTVEQQTTLQGHTIPQPVAYGQCPSSVWVFPPLPPQPHLYSTNSQDLLIQANEKTSGLRGFRKQFSGRFKRLVSRKEEPQLSAIPPELKPQLKTIYVY